MSEPLPRPPDGRPEARDEPERGVTAPSAARQSALMLAVRAGLLGLGFGNTILTARLLQPEGRGLYATIIAGLTLFTMTVGALGTGVALSAAHESDANRHRAISASIGLAASLGLLPIIVVLIWHPAGWLLAAGIAALSAPFVLFTSSAQFATLGRGRLTALAALQILQPGVMVVLGALLIGQLGLGLDGAMLAWTGSWTVTAVLAAGVLHRLGWRIRLLELPPWRAPGLLRFGTGAAIYGGLTLFTNRALLFLVQAVLGLREAGIFSIATTLSEPVTNVSSGISTAAYARLAPADSRPVEGRRFLQLAAIGALVSSVCIIAAAFLLLRPIFGSQYAPAIYPLPYLLLAYVVVSGRDIAAFWYIHALKTYRVPNRAALTGFLTTLCVSAVLIHPIGMAGAAIGSVIGAIVLMAGLLLGLRKRGLSLRSVLAPNRAEARSVLGLAGRLAPRRLGAWLRLPTSPGG